MSYFSFGSGSDSGVVFVSRIYGGSGTYRSVVSGPVFTSVDMTSSVIAGRCVVVVVVVIGRVVFNVVVGFVVLIVVVDVVVVMTRIYIVFIKYIVQLLA